MTNVPSLMTLGSYLRLGHGGGGVAATLLAGRCCYSSWSLGTYMNL